MPRGARHPPVGTAAQRDAAWAIAPEGERTESWIDAHVIAELIVQDAFGQFYEQDRDVMISTVLVRELSAVDCTAVHMDWRCRVA